MSAAPKNEPSPKRPANKKAAPARPSAAPSRPPKTSWLEGPASALPPAGKWPGERLGLPQSGVGSMAGYLPRVIALFIDWFASIGIAALVRTYTHDSRNTLSTLTWVVFVIELIVFVSIFGSSFGQAIVGLRVIRADNGGRPGFVRAVGRTLLLAIVIPPVVTDRDGRGLHDRAVNTVLVKSRTF